MIIEDVTGKMLRLATNVFVTQDELLPDSPHRQRAENAPEMDEETKNWLILDDFAKDFNTIKYKFAAHPLPLYHNDHLVQPEHANEILNGAIVEVQFHIQHWHIKEFDSFQATAEKIYQDNPYQKERVIMKK
ncbi:uncharacterized protein BJ212DRAFT_1304883 [Suillus subaureus]|uniref:Uncharacterized protein n=1 Tax=Suillus subaureus TaxID=48587 RepID=A0A9P7DSX8_9AGAM|nr:uncharacterized protein BJ212DRAFT_1304883 [Suillus subaureus]KAG1802346.1 hypothetical protein BJ212DRAFT_1304883 [Suillus subaureus]